MFKSIGKKLSVATAKVGMKIVKHSPEILFGLGVVGFVGTVVYATVKAGPAVNKVLGEHNDKHDDLDIMHDEGEIDDTELKKEVRKLYANTFFRTVKVTAPVVAMGLVSIGCFGGAQFIVVRRLGAMTTEYVLLQKTFDTYRSNVRADGGDTLDERYMYGPEKREMTAPVLDEDGNLTEETREVTQIRSIPENSYIWDHKSPTFTGIDSMDDYYVECKEKMLQHEFERKGVLTRADFLDAFKLKDDLDKSRKSGNAIMFGRVWSDKEGADNTIRITRYRIPDYESGFGRSSKVVLSWNEEMIYNAI